MAETKQVSTIRKEVAEAIHAAELKRRPDLYERRAEEGLQQFACLFVEAEECWRGEAVHFPQANLVAYPELGVLMEEGPWPEVNVAQYFKLFRWFPIDKHAPHSFGFMQDPLSSQDPFMANVQRLAVPRQLFCQWQAELLPAPVARQVYAKHFQTKEKVDKSPLILCKGDNRELGIIFNAPASLTVSWVADEVNLAAGLEEEILCAESDGYELDGDDILNWAFRVINGNLLHAGYDHNKIRDFFSRLYECHGQDFYREEVVHRMPLSTVVPTSERLAGGTVLPCRERYSGTFYCEDTFQNDDYNVSESRRQELFDKYLTTLVAPQGVRLNQGACSEILQESELQFLLEIGVPQELRSPALFSQLKSLRDRGICTIVGKQIQLTDAGRQAVRAGQIALIGATQITDAPDLLDKRAKQPISLAKLSAEEKVDALATYTECDKVRANLSSYDIAWLEDPNRGHWELWDDKEAAELVPLDPDSFVFARDPRSDIRESSVIAIDFGTKSTVVACQDDGFNTYNLPVGNGDIRLELQDRDFENPTVMQLLNLEEFLERYHRRAGRPFTRWEDIKVSHGANDSMSDINRSAEFYSYLSDLKQWAGEGKLKMHLRDLQKKNYVLPAYLDLGDCADGGFDPVEVYAYYVGLCINNMHNGIYLDYLLSFPVTYSKPVRQALLKSFERGLRQSLPASLLNDAEVMKRFRVVAGASEPAAYAICALKQYGFEPQAGEKVFYGIFDFGGGTTDFDFGLWTQAQDEDLYDYCIEHFGNQGDRYLGGENLLRLLAYEVFAQNVDSFRKQQLTIPFAAPLGQDYVPAELRGFCNDSQEARLNLKLMMEKLRPFWERGQGDAPKNELLEQYKQFKVSFLFDASGVAREKIEFHVDVEKLESILRQRIAKGVNQFFQALLDTFSQRYLGKTHEVKKINVFLAGNASKSVILQEIFQQQLEEWNAKINAESQGIFGNEDIFELFPALGTPEANEKKKQRQLDPDSDSNGVMPTGKTGVAWGLIEGRDSGRIEVKEEIAAESESRFAYFLGTQRGRFFTPKVRRDAEYGEWIKFLPARRTRNEVFYCSLPEALSGKLPCTDSGVRRKFIEIEADFTGDDCYIYVRPISVNSFEYAVGDADGNIDERTIKAETL